MNESEKQLYHKINSIDDYDEDDDNNNFSSEEEIEIRVNVNFLEYKSLSRFPKYDLTTLEMNENIEIIDCITFIKVIDKMVDFAIKISNSSHQTAFDLLCKNNWDITIIGDYYSTDINESSSFLLSKSIENIVHTFYPFESGVDLLYNCSLCYSHISKNDFIFLPCEHIFCKICWSNYLESKLKRIECKDLFKICCLDKNCTENIKYELWKNILSKLQHKRLQGYFESKLINLITTPELSLFKKCVNTSCKLIVHRKSSNILGNSNVICNCGCQFCFECFSLEIGNHYPFTCSQIQSMCNYGNFLVNYNRYNNILNNKYLSLFRSLQMIKDYGEKNNFAESILFNILKGKHQVIMKEIEQKNCPSCSMLTLKPTQSQYSNNFITYCGGGKNEGCECQFCWYCEEILNNNHHYLCKWDKKVINYTQIPNITTTNIITCPECNFTIHTSTPNISWLTCSKCTFIFCHICKKSLYSAEDDKLNNCCNYEEKSDKLKLESIIIYQHIHSPLFYLFDSMKKMFLVLNILLKSKFNNDDFMLMLESYKYTLLGMNFSFWLQLYLTTFVQNEKVLIGKIFCENLAKILYGIDGITNLDVLIEYTINLKNINKLLENNPWYFSLKKFTAVPETINKPWQVDMIDYLCNLKAVLNKTVCSLQDF